MRRPNSAAAASVFASDAGQHRAELGGSFEQLGRLVADHLHVAGFVHVGVVHVQQLQHFAFGDDVGRFRQNFHDAHLADADHHLERARVQEVADQHARGVAEQGVGGLAAAPQIGFVHHVVVQQGGRMDELDHRGQFMPVPRGFAQRAGHQQQQRGPQPLAAGADDVLGDLIDQHHVGRQTVPDDAIDLLHVFGDRSEQAGGVGGGGGSRRHDG